VNRKLFLNKGRTLLSLRASLKKARILPVVLLTEEDLKSGTYLQKLEEEFSGQISSVIVRSSFSSEDSHTSSGAGRFLSIPDVSLGLKDEFLEACHRVLASWDGIGSAELLIQPMFKNCIRSGVVLTADYASGAPYITVNYDESGSLSSVTGGTGNYDSLVMLPNAKSLPHPWLYPLQELIFELQEIFAVKELDIEFAFDSSKQELWLLQIRPMVKVQKSQDASSFLQQVDFLCKNSARAFSDNPNLLGKIPLYGVMPDWNPAEMIGIRPKPLALSLYKELITDSVWAYQRNNYGYRNLRSCPLMISMGGIPFIDVRASFNSFVPKALPDSIADKLVTHYLRQLSSSPYLHDKVEFEVVHSCYYFGIDTRLAELLHNGFNLNEIKRIEFSLLELTNQVLDPVTGLCHRDLKKIETLKALHQEVLQADTDWLSKVFWLVEYCKRYGTLPFAGVARAAFIAVQITRSLITQNLITQDQYEAFLNSLNTVSKSLSRDLNLHMAGHLSKEEFLESYGHLRPGTYDIHSLRYDEAYETYFFNHKPIATEASAEPQFVLPKETMKKIDALLLECGLSCNTKTLFDFARMAIEGREYAKFVFTRTLSEVLSLIKKNAQNEFCIRDQDLPFLEIQTILSGYASYSSKNSEDLIRDRIEKKQAEYQFTLGLKLPSLMSSQNDFYCFKVHREEPNFVSSKSINAPIVLEEGIATEDCQGKIVLIRSADPGYDYLFSKNIGGLITLYGGANSHMAIRCAELGIPAVIGSGETRFSLWSRANALYLDCLNRQVQVIA